MFIKERKTNNLAFQNWGKGGFLELEILVSKKELIYIIFQIGFEIRYVLIKGLWTMLNKGNKVEDSVLDFENYI